MGKNKNYLVKMGGNKNNKHKDQPHCQGGAPGYRAPQNDLVPPC